MSRSRPPLRKVHARSRELDERLQEEPVFSCGSHPEAFPFLVCLEIAAAKEVAESPFEEGLSLGGFRIAA